MKYTKIIIGAVVLLSVIGIIAIFVSGNALKGAFYGDKLNLKYDRDTYNWKYDKPLMRNSALIDQLQDTKAADCGKTGDVLAGGDKESTAMMVGQENWDKKYESYKAKDFIPLLPKYIAEKLGKITNEANCFFAATDFHIAQCKSHIMTNAELAQILNEHYCPLKKSSQIKYGDLITVQAPVDIAGGYVKNYHHAAIVMSKNFIFDKPNGDLSSVRIAPMQTVYDEWAKYFKCVAPWPQNKGYQCVTVRYWRFQE